MMLHSKQPCSRTLLVITNKHGNRRFQSSEWHMVYNIIACLIKRTKKEKKYNQSDQPARKLQRESSKNRRDFSYTITTNISYFLAVLLLFA
jgi:hypothetical protein